MPKGLLWFRMYAEFAFDPKIQTMSETLQRRYTMFLCLKCNGDIPGLTDETAACALRISLNDLLETKKMLISIGLICENFEINNWDKRQYRSDSSTDRVKKFRGKKLNGKHETLQKRYRNGNVTPLSVSVSESKSVSFNKPTIEELKEYIKEKKYNINPEKFMAYYDSNGWMVGRNKMKSWKAALVTWNHSNFNKPQKSLGYVEVASNREESSVDPVQKFLDNFPDDLKSIKKEYEDSLTGALGLRDFFNNKLLELFYDNKELNEKMAAHLKQYPKSDAKTYRLNYIMGKYGIPEVENEENK